MFDSVVAIFFVLRSFFVTSVFDAWWFLVDQSLVLVCSLSVFGWAWMHCCFVFTLCLIRLPRGSLF